LEAIKAHDLQGGSWLNIIGYVRKPEQRQKKTTRPNIDDVKIVAIPIVQAIIVWGAGAIKVPDYEAALVSQREVKGAAELPAMHWSRITMQIKSEPDKDWFDWRPFLLLKLFFCINFQKALKNGCHFPAPSALADWDVANIARDIGTYASQPASWRQMVARDRTIRNTNIDSQGSARPTWLRLNERLFSASGLFPSSLHWE
jgi:Telomere capping, CST complex subunit